MYILKNAFRCIARAKGRNILIGLIVLLLSVSSCIGLSIKEANKTLKNQYADDMEITATLNAANTRENGNLSLDKLKEFADNELVKNFYYSSSLYFAAGDGIEPMDVAGSFKQNKDFRDKYGDIKSGEEKTTSEVTTDSESSDSSDSKRPDAPPDMGGQQGGNTFITQQFFFNMASMNDFTVVGYSSDDAIPDYVSSLNVLDADSDALNCVISQNLAEENELEVNDTFTLKNPDNEDEVFTFTIVGICDTSESGESQDTSSNASFNDNYIHVRNVCLEKIIADSATTNATDDDDEESNALTANYSGTFVFANLDNYNTFGDTLGDDYRLVSEDVSRYEQSISQLETLGKYATYFLIVIFIIGAFVLVIINLFSIRNRKYEIGVLTAIGMKKYKVATQFVVELFVVTFIALIIGSAIGGVASVPVTNSLLVSINSSDSSDTMPSNVGDMPQGMGGGSSDNGSNTMTPPGGFGENFKDKMADFGGNMNQYITEISSATDLTVILQMILVGMGLTLISSAAAVAFVMRYEPLKILNNRD